MKGKEKGRTMVLTVEVEGKKEVVCWGPSETTDEDVEGMLEGRSRAAFAEEIFATVSALDIAQNTLNRV